MSTARHQLAGAPGTGTTIDNMASRVKAHCRINGTTAAVIGSFNVSGTIDAPSGSHTVNYTAPMATAGTYTAVGGTTQGSAVFLDLVGSSTTGIVLQSYSFAGTAADSLQKNAAIMGDLA